MTTMDTGARAWLLKTAKLNYWRISEWYDFDDLVQDGYLCWARIVYKYERVPGRIRSRRHLMALFKTTYHNHIHDLSKGETRRPVEAGILDVVASGFGNEYSAWDALEYEGDHHEYERLVVEAPTVLQSLLRAILTDGPSLTLRAAYRINRNGERETLNQRLCKLIGANPNDYDYATALRSFLSAA